MKMLREQHRRMRNQQPGKPPEEKKPEKDKKEEKKPEDDKKKEDEIKNSKTAHGTSQAD